MGETLTFAATASTYFIPTQCGPSMIPYFLSRRTDASGPFCVLLQSAPILVDRLGQLLRIINHFKNGFRDAGALAFRTAGCKDEFRVRIGL
ncbi:MAG: hypothetical protein ACJAWC_002055 [Yoonia sp.]|jgi:hypothetical protein